MQQQFWITDQTWQPDGTDTVTLALVDAHTPAQAVAKHLARQSIFVNLPADADCITWRHPITQCLEREVGAARLP
jgi:hypothetical protein